MWNIHKMKDWKKTLLTNENLLKKIKKKTLYLGALELAAL